MPFFHPVFNEFPIKEEKYETTFWKLLKARLFGNRVKYSDGKYTVYGWRYAGVLYITEERYNP